MTRARVPYYPIGISFYDFRLPPAIGMSRLGVLLGSATRGNIVEALALANKPLTAYRVSKAYNMNVAKVYLEMKRLAELGLVKTDRRNRSTEYTLADDDLRRLAVKLSSRVVTYDNWSSREAKRARFRMGMAAVPPVSLAKPSSGVEEKQTRMPGELENLATLARKKFDAKYTGSGVREYVRV